MKGGRGEREGCRYDRGKERAGRKDGGKDRYYRREGGCEYEGGRTKGPEGLSWKGGCTVY